MTTMTRLSSLSIILFLIMPMVRECCLPVTPTLPCHETRRTDDLSCTSNQQAIFEGKAAPDMRATVLWYDLPAMHLAIPAVVPPLHVWVAEDITTYSPPPSDLYLRTGALLI